MHSLDDRISIFVNGHYAPWLDDLMILFTDRYVWIPLYCVLALIVMRKYGWKHGLVMLAMCGAAVGISDWVCATAIRPYVARLRPLDPGNPLSEYLRSVNGCPKSFSFPSCHAANTFALSAFMTLLLRSRRVAVGLFIWATMVCCSRIYLGAHYASDILCGALIGTVIAFLVYFACKKMTAKWAILPLLFIIPFSAGAAEKVKFEWGGEFATIFDNREGSARNTPAQTYFLTRLAPEIGLSFDKKRHKIMAGAVWTQPIGCEWEGKRISPLAYYRYSSSHVSASLGMFPRSQLIQKLPEYLESDSTAYFQYTLRGAMIQYVGKEGFFEAVCDWRGMQTRNRREAFAVIAQGEWRRKLLLAGGHAMLNHLALAKGAENQYVIDNIIANPYIGVDFLPLIAPSARFSRLELKTGLLAGLTRDRGDKIWRNSVGFRGVLDVEWWRLGLRNTVYVANNPLFPIHDRYGTLLNEGEPYFSEKFYNRTELSGLLVSYRDMVRLKAELDFHVTTRDFMFYQRLVLTVNI